MYNCFNSRHPGLPVLAGAHCSPLKVPLESAGACWVMFVLFVQHQWLNFYEARQAVAWRYQAAWGAAGSVEEMLLNIYGKQLINGRPLSSIVKVLQAQEW